MLDILQFVRGAVAKKDLVPVLTHFCIYDGRIQGGNGRVAIDAPCEELAGLRLTVPAGPFLDAIDNCGDEPKFKYKDGFLYVYTKQFKAKLPTLDTQEYPLEMPDVQPIQNIEIDQLEHVREFVGTDASRLWNCGVLLTKEYAYATNNIVIVRTRIKGPKAFQLNLPGFAIDELIRVGYEHEKIYMSENALTFMYGDGAWLRTRLYQPGDWPEVEQFFGPKPNKQWIDTKGLYEKVERIRPFCPQAETPMVKFDNEGVKTLDGDMAAVIAYKDVFDECAFRIEPLLQVLAVAKRMNFNTYPKPCPFIGEHVEGAVVGVLL